MRVPLPKGLKFLTDLMIENGLNPWLVGSAARTLYNASKKKQKRTTRGSRSTSTRAAANRRQVRRRNQTENSSRPPSPRDYDIILTGGLAGLFPLLTQYHLTHTTNTLGGVKLAIAGVSVDIWSGDIAEFLVRTPVAQVGLAIHLQSGCVLMTGENSQGLKGLITSRSTAGDAPLDQEHYRRWVTKYLS